MAIADEAVAYPIAMMRYHEIVNDTVAGENLVVTYCSLCDSVALLDPHMEATGQTPSPSNHPEIWQYRHVIPV